MTSYRRALFDIDVMARLRFPMPEDPDVVSDEEVEAVWENRRSFVEQYRELLEQRLDELMTDGYDIDAAPDPLVEELGWVGDQLAWMQIYRDQLIVFARTFASEAIPARTIGDCTNMSHSTIVRMVNEDSVAAIAPEVSGAAYHALHAVDNHRDDPEFYLRLKAALVSTEEGKEHDTDQ